MDTAAAWEQHADAWIDWADPAHEDGFWTTTWPALQGLLPPPRGVTVDLGCGEGRGARELSRLGHRVLAVDRAPTLARAAAAKGTAVVLADAARLPLASGTAALVFASMSLLDIGDLSATLAEVNRVLDPSGVLVAAIVHPAISVYDPAALRQGRTKIPAPYLTERPYVDHVERNCKSMTFTSIHRPLRDYLVPMLQKGFVMTGFREEGDGPIPWLLAFRMQRTAAAVDD